MKIMNTTKTETAQATELTFTTAVLDASYEVAAAWITDAGLLAVVNKGTGVGRKVVYCSYVGVPSTHPAYKVTPEEHATFLTAADCNITSRDGKDPAVLMAATVMALLTGSVMPCLALHLSAHQGVDYSALNVEPAYPVATNQPLWFFGFAYAVDRATDTTDATLEYCKHQCEQLAMQLAALSTREAVAAHAQNAPTTTTAQ